MARVNITPTCHLWTGSRGGGTGRHKYGTFGFAGSKVFAHRWIFAHANGPVPDGKFVLHHCDNPLCVRVDHLFIGTPKDNMDDMRRKGRAFWRNGELQGKAKLTDAKAADIRRRAANGETRTSLAARYEVHISTIANVILGVSWNRPTDRRVAGPPL